MAVRIETMVERSIGIHISHHVIHGILKDEELAENQPAKARQQKWVRYERRYSNSLWHTDYKQLPDGRWFVSFQDDASRLVVEFGVFDEATTDHAISVLEMQSRGTASPPRCSLIVGRSFMQTKRRTRGHVRDQTGWAWHQARPGPRKAPPDERQAGAVPSGDRTAPKVLRRRVCIQHRPECQARRPCRRPVPCRRDGGSGGTAG